MIAAYGRREASGDEILRFERRPDLLAEVCVWSDGEAGLAFQRLEYLGDAFLQCTHEPPTMEPVWRPTLTHAPQTMEPVWRPTLTCGPTVPPNGADNARPPSALT